jgi:hypothetical protein
MARKVLIGIRQNHIDDNNVKDCRLAVEGWLYRMGYEYDVVAFEDGSEYAASFADTDNGYEFIVWIRMSGGIVPGENIATLLDGSAVIPTFLIMALDDSTSTADLVVGVRRTQTYASHYKWVTHKNGFEYPVNTAEWKEASGFAGQWTAITTVQDPDGVGTQFAMAKREGSATTLYFDGGGSVGFNLPLLLQEAIDDKVISKPPHKLIGTMDIDDLPDANTTLDDVQQVYALQAKYNIPIAWGVPGDATALSNINDEVISFVAQRTPDKGGLIFPIEHQGGTFWNDPVATIDTFYKLHNDNIQSEGISTGEDDKGYDSWGYHYFNTNNINDNGAQVCEKYGFKVIRLENGEKTTNGDGKVNWIGSPEQAGPVFSYHRGMLLVGSGNSIASGDLSLDRDTNISEFALHISHKHLIEGLAHGNVIYMHGGNFYNGHSGGNAPGILVMSTVGDVMKHMRDVATWELPTALSAVLDRQLAANAPELKGSINDKWNTYLESLGYTGSLNDKEVSWLEDQIK